MSLRGQAESDFDFIVIGGGMNGLVAAGYLCKAGLRTLIVEKQAYLGGGAATSEVTLPGFHHDLMATSTSTLRLGNVMEDLELAHNGYREVEADVLCSTPFRNSNSVTLYKDFRKTLKCMSQFSPRDAKRFSQMYNDYMESREIFRGNLYSPPPSFSAMMSLLEESDHGLDFLQFSYKSARDWLEENFESEEIRAFLTLWATNHTSISPEDPRGALLIMLFVSGIQYNGLGIPVGGIRTLVTSLSRYIEGRNGTILTGKRATEILVKEGSARGIKLSDGMELRANRGVISSVPPKDLFINLLLNCEIPREIRRKAENFKYANVTQVMVHAALDEWFDFEYEADRRAAIVQIGSSLEQISMSFNQCVNGQVPSNPFMTVNNTSGYDSSRSPKGKHILWNYIRAPALIKGRPWSDQEKEQFADSSMDILSEFAPNARRIVVKRVVLGPQDIESMNSTFVNGDGGGGKLSIDQSLALRPFPRWSDYKTPIDRLYMCGPATHPGGGVSGASGHNAAQIALAGLKI